MMSYATEFIAHISALNITKFRLYDIILHTGSGYPNSVLRDIKRILKACNKHLEEEIINNKGVKEFTIIEG